MTRILALLLSLLFAIVLVGCADSNDGPAERLGEDIDEAAQDIEDGLEDAADDIEDAADDVEDQMDPNRN